MAESVTASFFSIGRIVSWLIVALMAGASLYAAVIAILNWGTIGV